MFYDGYASLTRVESLTRQIHLGPGNFSFENPFSQQRILRVSEHPNISSI